MPDFFLEAANPDEQLKHSRDLDRKLAYAERSASSSASSAADAPEVVNIMEAVKGIISDKYVEKVNAIFVFVLKGKHFGMSC